MTTTTQKPSLLARLTECVHVLTMRAVDMTALTNRRIAAIEDRLAELDRGDDASAAIETAINSVNARRVASGGEPLMLRIEKGADGKVSRFIHTRKMPAS